MPTARRAFLETLAAVPLAPAALAPAISAAEPPPSGHEAVAEALAEAVKRHFGAHLDATELGAIRKELTRGLERAERLRQAARLGNADEPVSRFEARPPEPTAKGARR